MFGTNLSTLTQLNDVLSPIKMMRRSLYIDNCRPEAIAWQWAVKDSPEIQNCSKLCVKKNICPEKRFFPRFKKVYVANDIVSCTKPKKVLTWKEYFSYLLPDEVTHRPPLVTCRKILEMRRLKCIENKDWEKCLGGPCSPPVEWYGQAVIQSACSKIPQPSLKPAEKFCPPPDHMIPRCVAAKLAVCPKKPKSCLEEKEYVPPFSHVKGGVEANSQYIIKCPIKCRTEPAATEKGMKLKCKTYGEFKGVECPKHMFTRFMSVDLPGGTLLPVSAKEFSVLKETKKGTCSQKRSFHTGRIFMSDNLPEYGSPHTDTTSYLQPSKSGLAVNKVIERTGFKMRDIVESSPRESEVKMKTPAQKVVEDDTDDEIEAIKPKEELKSPLQRLLERQGKKNKKVEQTTYPLLNKPVDVEDVPYQFRKFSSSPLLLKKVQDEELGKICAGCPGIEAALNKTENQKKSKLNCRMRGAGKCPGPTIKYKPGEEPPKNPYQKCRSVRHGLCAQPRVVECKKERIYDIDCMKKGGQKKKYHTSCATLAETKLSCKKKPTSETNKIYPPVVEECPKPKGYVNKGCGSEAKKKVCEEHKSRRGLICSLMNAFGIGCGKKLSSKRL